MSLRYSGFSGKQKIAVAVLSLGAIAVYLVMRYVFSLPSAVYELPLITALIVGGLPLTLELSLKLLRGDFGSDLLAGLSIVTSVILGEYLAGTIVVLMLSGGESLETYAVNSASSVLRALAKRMPSAAHRKSGQKINDVQIKEVAIGDELLVYPYEICPVDGTVIEGHGVMDESYLTGEPYMIEKIPGTGVLSGSINGGTALTIRADKLAVDSRYAGIMKVMEESQQHRPRFRRLADQLGAIYTPVAVFIALLAWALSGESIRFLSVLVIATPCPLLIAIPVAIIGSITLSAKRSIIIKDPIALERVDRCRTLIFDKTGTLTYGKPELIEKIIFNGFGAERVLSFAASLERYSKHPLAQPILNAARQEKVNLRIASQISEKPGEGLRGSVDGSIIEITSRKNLYKKNKTDAAMLPVSAGGMECVVLINGSVAAFYRFRDIPRKEGTTFIEHLKKKHRIDHVLLVSGDREEDVRYLAEQIGIKEVFAGASPEQKLRIVQEKVKTGDTVFVGDGINDAPALMASTVGIAIGQASDITTQAAGVVVMDSSLNKVDEFMHISRRMRAIALQSAVGGMALSVAGMAFAAFGYLQPVAGAIVQEIIDLVVVVNALRAAFLPGKLTDL
ncbi:MAG: cadmium-translocating P-type ATPase [Fibrobacter sp.]|mgnify:CR=1 FL=1|nr:cadmium-translocating P-type ATPase [Fibrobacter sp.]